VTNRPKISSSDWIAVARYVSGEATPEERASLEACATADPAFAQLLSESFIGWTTAGVAPRQRDRQAAWASIEQRSAAISAPVDTRPRKQNRLVEHHPRRTGWSALFGAMMMAAVIVAGWRFGAVRMIAGLTASESAYTTYVTANGERATITLPDGNTVALNVASRLQVPTNYDAGNHLVRLPVGEALFTVSHHTGTPFTVVAGTTTARVLGTNFLVRHYRTDTVATIAVADGKVAVGNTVVTAQQLVEVGRAGVLRMRPVDASSFTFATGVFTLEATRLSNAIPELDRWYDADIRLGDPTLAVKQIEGKVRAGSLSDLVELLEWTCEVRVVRNGRVLTLYPKAK
jgi:transmembrane sensor